MGSTRATNPEQKKNKAKPRPHPADIPQRNKASGAPAGLPRFLKGVQAKLAIGQPGDAYERHADHIAEAAANGSAARPARDPIAPAVRARSAAPALPASDSGLPLSADVRARVEPALSADLSHVRVHSGPADREVARDLQAKAFTQGNHIWLGPEQSHSDTKLMAHEAAHVVQQAGPQPAPALQRAVAPDPVKDDPANDPDSCAGWESDPQSLSKVAAERYVRDHIPGFNHGGVQAINCDPNAAKPPYTCHVQFGCGMIVDISVYKGYIWAQVNDASNPKPDAPMCRYDYQCPPKGGLILTSGECLLTPFP
jgi:hypothetical protein